MLQKNRLHSILKPFTSALLLTVLLISTLTTGCNNREEGKKLADAGITASERIAEYYDSLTQDLVDTMELESFRDGISGGGIFSDTAKKKLEDQITAIQARARLARGLGKTYSSLKDLTEYNAGAEVKESATNLADAIKGLPIIPGSAVIPSAIIGEISSDIADWKQSKDIRRGAELLLLTLVKIKELMEKETSAYKSISEERYNKASATIERLIQKEMVTSLPLLRKVPESLSLRLIDDGKPVKDQITQKGLIEVAKIRFYRQSLASANAADSEVSTLDSLIESHRNFGKERGSGISRVLAAIERAQTYLDEIQKLRQPPAEEN